MTGRCGGLPDEIFRRHDGVWWVSKNVDPSVGSVQRYQSICRSAGGTAGRVSATLRLHAAETASTEHAGDTCFLDVVERTLCHARAAQSTWATRTLLDRLRILKTLRRKIAANPRNLAADVSRLKLSETLAAEVLPLLDACRFLEIEAPRILKENQIGTRARPMWLWGTRVTLRLEPLGVVLIIGPSNYPLMLPGIQILQAVCAGNAVLIKPGTNGTAAVQTLADLAAASGLPADLIQILPEDPLVAVTAMRCGVDKVFLTGAVTTGRAVRRELADAGTPAVMELSGCDAVFILDDADPELASDCLLFGLTLNQSQTCMAPRRVFASDQMVDRVLLLVQKKSQLGRGSKLSCGARRHAQRLKRFRMPSPPERNSNQVRSTSAAAPRNCGEW